MQILKIGSEITNLWPKNWKSHTFRTKWLTSAHHKNAITSVLLARNKKSNMFWAPLNIINRRVDQADFWHFRIFEKNIFLKKYWCLLIFYIFRTIYLFKFTKGYFLRVVVNCSHIGKMQGSLRVGVSDGDLVHKALPSDCKIILLSDFFSKSKW